MRLRFTKMHGAGNDFVMFNGFDQPLPLAPGFLRRVADRHFGVGADQILVVERPSLAGADFRYRIFNADGGEVEQCGNGARCFVQFVRDQGLTQARAISVQTAMGLIRPELQEDGRVRVDMGAPIFDPERIPFAPGARSMRGSHRISQQWELDLPGGARRWVSAVSMGNPHLVQVVDDVDSAAVRSEGPALEHHGCVPQRANIGFMQVLSRQAIRLRVWERSVGETLSCGSGACAAVVSGIGLGLLDAEVEVQTRGGDLRIEWDTVGPVFMTGPVQHVFDGELDAELFQQDNS
jgi:diaminopimelate epimerase